MQKRSIASPFAFLTATLNAALLIGCSTNFVPDTIQPEQSEIGTINGTVHGGQAAISGARIYLYAAGTGGYGTAATSILKNTGNSDANGSYVVTDNSGNFTISGTNSCVGGTQVYLVAYGGNPGGAPGTNNTAIMQMAGLGQCPTSGNLGQLAPYVVINEVSTVVFAYAMGGFGTSAMNIGSSGTALARTSIANAMANVSNIMNIATGGASTTASGNANSVVPQAKIYALADTLAACVNTTASTSSQCGTLFSNTVGTGGTPDEAKAIFYIVHNPTTAVGTLCSLGGTTGPFPGAACSSVTDWTLPIVYNGVVSQPGNLAFDASGNAWISDSGKKAVLELTALGTMNSYTNGGSFGAISNVAVNPMTGSVWAADSTNNKVYILDSTGSMVTTITSGSLNKPSAIAFDRSGNGYVANAGAYVIGEYNSGGTLTQTATYPTMQGYTSGIAVDYSGNVYTAGGPGNAGVGVLMAGSTTGQYYGDGSSGGSSYLALDATSNTPIVQAPYWTQENNVWTMTSSGIGERYYLFSTGYTFGGIVDGTYLGWMSGIQPTTTPSSLALDGAGSLWIANGTPVTVSWGPTSPLSGITVSSSYGATGMNANGFSTGAAAGVGAYTAAPDLSGNVWVVNEDGSVAELMGLSTPVVTPIVPGKFASKP